LHHAKKSDISSTEKIRSAAIDDVGSVGVQPGLYAFRKT
jgi:hypothetical protein